MFELTNPYVYYHSEEDYLFLVSGYYDVRMSTHFLKIETPSVTYYTPVKECKLFDYSVQIGEL